MKKKDSERSTVERRAHGRVSTCIKVRFAGPGGSVEEGTTRDISRGGAFIETGKDYKPGERFEIFFSLPDGSREVSVLGEVVRQEGQAGVGVRFIVIEPAQRAELEGFIDALLAFGGSQARKHPRIKAQVRVNLKSAGAFRQALMDNISQGGMYLTVDQDFDVGSGLEMVLVHPRTLKSVEIVGEVIHQKDIYDAKSRRKVKGLGIRFAGLPADKKRALDDFIKSLLD